MLSNNEIMIVDNEESRHVTLRKVELVKFSSEKGDLSPDLSTGSAEVRIELK